MTTTQTAVMVGVIALGTFLTRALPFVVFTPQRKTPKYVLYLGRVLPFAVTAMLVVYCLSGVQLFAWPYGIPEVLAVGAVVFVYLRFKNQLAAIAVGTVLYMVLVQAVF